MIDLIVNPTAGSGKANQVAKEAMKWLDEKNVEYHSHITQQCGDATAIARQCADNGSDTVIAFGGDGTISEVAAGLFGKNTALGIVSCGTGNDFIKSAHIPQKWEEALEFILNKPARPVNCGTVNGKCFINECGTGFDVAVLDYTEKAKKYVHGILPYLYGVFRAIGTFHPQEMHIEIGNEVVIEGKKMVFAIGNGSFIGGGIPIVPGSDLQDNLFDVLVVDAIPRYRIPFYLPSLLKGTLYKKEKVSHRYLTSHCVLKTKGMRLNKDGEIFPMEEAVFEMHADKLLLHW